MNNLNTISHVEQNEIALAEHAAKDLIAIGEALSGLLNLHLGGVVLGMSATQYLEALQSLVAAAGKTAMKNTPIEEAAETFSGGSIDQIRTVSAYQPVTTTSTYLQGSNK